MKKRGLFGNPCGPLISKKVYSSAQYCGLSSIRHHKYLTAGHFGLCGSYLIRLLGMGMLISINISRCTSLGLRVLPYKRTPRKDIFHALFALFEFNTENIFKIVMDMSGMSSELRASYFSGPKMVFNKLSSESADRQINGIDKQINKHICKVTE